MNVDDVLMVLILAGIGVSVFYMATEYAGWRRYQTAETSRLRRLGRLHADRVQRGISTVRSDRPKVHDTASPADQ